MGKNTWHRSSAAMVDRFPISLRGFWSGRRTTSSTARFKSLMCILVADNTRREEVACTSVEPMRDGCCCWGNVGPSQLQDASTPFTAHSSTQLSSIFPPAAGRSILKMTGTSNVIQVYARHYVDPADITTAETQHITLEWAHYERQSNFITYPKLNIQNSQLK